MKLHNTAEITGFLSAVNSCKGDVYLTSAFGDRFNLKSCLSQYIAIAELLKDHGDSLELFCDNHEDEGNFYEFFKNFPTVVG